MKTYPIKYDLPYKNQGREEVRVYRLIDPNFRPLLLGPTAVRGVGCEGRQWPAAGTGALTAAGPAWDLLKEVTINFITSTVVWPQVKQKGGKHSPPPQQKN